MKMIKTALKYKTFSIGLLMALSVVVVAIFAKQIAPYEYDKIDMSAILKAPDSQHLFGTDHLGRDLFSRIVYGSRLALTAGILAVVLQGLIGVSVGLIAGYFGKSIEKTIGMVIYLTLSLPPLVLIIVIISLLGPSLMNALIAISLILWARIARIVTVKTMAVKNLPYIDAARAFGENNFNILLRYILPNISPIVILILSTAFPQAIMLTSSLSFLGIGAQPPQPDWGVLVSDGLAYIIGYPWVSILPGAVLAYTILGFNILGEGIRDLLDPTLKI